eukprot:593215_1
MILYTTIILPSEYTCSYESSKNKSFRLKFCTDTAIQQSFRQKPVPNLPLPPRHAVRNVDASSAGQLPNGDVTASPSSVLVVGDTLHYFGEEYRPNTAVLVKQGTREFMAAITQIIPTEVLLRKQSGQNTRLWMVHLRNRKSTIRRPPGTSSHV